MFTEAVPATTVWVVPSWVAPSMNFTVPLEAGATVAVSVTGDAGAVCGLGGLADNVVVVAWTVGSFIDQVPAAAL